MSERRCWLMKTEPGSYSIDDLQADGQTAWEGVRNYQARNYMRDLIQVGDEIVIYHSNAEPPGAVGLARVASAPCPDPSAFDPHSKYYDPDSDPAAPRWVLVDVAFVERFPRLVPLDELKRDPALAGLEVARKGSRLSITVLSPEHLARIRALAQV